MTIKEIISDIETFAPVELQESWDNSGVQVGRTDVICSGVFVALDVTDETISAAIKCGANLIVSHHPVIFDPVRSITPNNYVGNVIMGAIKNNITIYASHTPFDITEGGINDFLATKLELNNIEPLSESGMGRAGVLNERMSPTIFVQFLKDRLNLNCVRMSCKTKQYIHKIALCGGSGGSLIDDAVRVGADMFVTGDVKYHNFIQYQNVINIVDVGHFESEYQFIHIVDDIISKKITTFASHIVSSNPTVIV